MKEKDLYKGMIRTLKIQQNLEFEVLNSIQQYKSILIRTKIIFKQLKAGHFRFH